MPIIRNKDDWAAVFRKQVRKLGKGWTVRETPKSGKVQIEIRSTQNGPHQPISNFLPTVENYQKKIRGYQTTTLDFKWDEITAGDAYTRIRNIYSLVAKDGYSLKQAAKIAAGKAPKTIGQLDWAGAINDFKVYKTTTGRSIA